MTTPAEMSGLGLDDRFFCRIAVKNGLLDEADAREAVAETRRRRRDGGDDDLTVADVLLDRGVLTPKNVSRIREAQAASQVVRLDSLYGELLLARDLVPPDELEDAYRVQREERFRVRVGEILVNRGHLSSVEHRAILEELLARIREEERQYIRTIQSHQDASRAGRAGPDRNGDGASLQEKETDQFASVDPDRETDPFVGSPSGEATARLDGETEEIVPAEPDPVEETEEMPVPPGDRQEEETEEMPVPPVLDSGAWGGETREVPPPDDPRRDEESGGEGVYEANVQAIREQARRAGEGLGATESAMKRNQLLESAIDLHWEEKVNRASLLESDVLVVESDINHVEDLIESGFRNFEEGKGRDVVPSDEAFNADEYVRRRKRKSFRARAIVLGIGGVVLVVGAVLFWTRQGAVGRLGEAREALRDGDHERALELTEGLAGFFVSEADVARIREDAGLSRDLREAERLLEAGSFDAARERAEEVRRKHERLEEDLREELSHLADEAARTVDRVRYERLLARGRDHEDNGYLEMAVRSYERAREFARGDRAAAERIARIKDSFLGRIERTIAPHDEEAMQEAIDACRTYLEIFPDDQRVAARKADLVYEFNLWRGNRALREAETVENVNLAIQYYVLAKQGRFSIEIDSRLGWARQAKDFLERRAEAEEEAERGRYPEAMQGFRDALGIARRLEDQIGEEELPSVISAIDAEAIGQRIADLETLQEDLEVQQNERTLLRQARSALRESDWTRAAAIFRRLAELPSDAVSRYARIARVLPELEGTVYVPPGPFVMGSDDGEAEEAPRHEARIEEGFLVDLREVTNEEYEEFVRDRRRSPPEHWRREVRVDGRSARSYREVYRMHPVVYVEWHDARAYARWAGKRLPTEKEWERAARGTDGRAFPWGEEADESRGQIHRRSTRMAPIQTAAVGSHPRDRSPTGCLDMAGNVVEWTASRPGPYPGGEGRENEDERVLRGGSWRWEIDSARCAHRDSAPPDATYPDVGFRCVQDVPDLLQDFLD